MTLTGWISVALVAGLASVALFGFAMFKIGKSKRQTSQEEAHYIASSPIDAKQQHTENTSEESSPGHANYLRKVFDFTEKHSGAFLAIFTLLLAIVTGFLWRATRDLVKGSDYAAERQLRAYVFPVKIKVENFRTGTPIVGFVEVKNSGQTPAYKFTCFAKMIAGSFPQTDFSGMEQATTPVAYLGPGAATWFTPRADRSLSSEQSEAIVQGTAAIYIFGEIRYVDAFNKARRTAFRAIARGDHGYMHTQMGRQDVLILSPDSEGGNDAN